MEHELHLTVLSYGGPERRPRRLEGGGRVTFDRCDDQAALLEALASRVTSAVLFDGDHPGARQALARAREADPGVPMVWLGLPLEVPLGDLRRAPSAICHPATAAGRLVETLGELVLRPHSAAVAAMASAVVSEAFAAYLDEVGRGSATQVDSTQRSRMDINAVVALCGPGLCGHLIISAPREVLCRGLRGGDDVIEAPRRGEIEDLAGEIANLAASRLKHRLDDRSIPCEIGTPQRFRRGERVSPAAVPGLVVELEAGGCRVAGALTLELVEPAAALLSLSAASRRAPPVAGEAVFF